MPSDATDPGSGPRAGEDHGPPEGTAPRARGRAGSIRARVRAEMVEEIKATARRHLATEGADLSLRAVARDMGMVSSALYRYFAGRDELLTALIIDAYDDCGAAAESADAAVAGRAGPTGRWLAVCHGVRRWALAHPAEYALVFGSPVPGYAAPPDTVPAALRTPAVLLRVLADGHAAGLLPDPGPAGVPPAVLADLRRIRAGVVPDVPEALLAAGMLGWTALFGMLSFELFGQLENGVEAREEYFDHQVRRTAAMIGLPDEPPAG